MYLYNKTAEKAK